MERLLADFNNEITPEMRPESMDFQDTNTNNSEQSHAENDGNVNLLPVLTPVEYNDSYQNNFQEQQANTEQENEHDIQNDFLPTQNRESSSSIMVG